MRIVSIFENLFSMIFAFSRFCVLLTTDYHSDRDDKMRDKSESAIHETMEIIEIVTACVLAVVGILVLRFRFYSTLLGRAIFVLPISVVLLELVVDLVLSSGTVNALVRSNSKGIISPKDRFAIDAIARCAGENYAGR